ncbi:MAG: hypothetical protein KUG71_02055 [Porticoccaceae bacterium]|nr:hypothetical protein [Porticoccaceae bacterium]
MQAEEALVFFLSRALKNKKERYLGFASKTKTQNKFLDSIYHDLESALDKGKRRTSLPAEALLMPGYIFAPDQGFGVAIEQFEGVVDESKDSFLFVSEDGRYGVHGPETFIDSRAYYAV